MRNTRNRQGIAAITIVVVALVLQGCSTCGLVKDLVLARHMAHQPVYAMSKGDCVEVSPDKAGGGGDFFADAGCQEKVPYLPMSYKTFCNDNLKGNAWTKSAIGNPKKWRRGEIDPNPAVPGQPETLWSMSHGSRLKLVSLDQTKIAQRPYVKRAQYREDDDCALEMRIYKQKIEQKNLKPALVVHGGGWTYRGALSIAGIETIAPNLTDRGYVVFAPFYRLLGESDGPPECHDSVGEKIIDDITAALDWVQDHGSAYGMDPSLADEVLVVGQSAGSQLVGYLAVHRSEAVKGALLLYPPTDLMHLAMNLREGGIYYGKGWDKTKKLLLEFTDVDDLDKIDADLPIAEAASFPQLVDPDPAKLPPLFIIHGDRDELVPIEQSTRFCAARDPNRHPEAGEYSAGSTKVFTCGAGSELHVVHGANHILDLRCFSGDFNKLIKELAGEDDAFKLCAAGSKEGASEVRKALLKAYESLEQPFEQPGSGGS